MVRHNRPENEEATTDALEWFLSSVAPADADPPAEIGPLAEIGPAAEFDPLREVLADPDPAADRHALREHPVGHRQADSHTHVHDPRRPAPQASFEPHLVPPSVPARPRATSGKRHPALRMGEVGAAAALVLLLSVGAVTVLVEEGIDAEDLTLPARDAATRSELGELPGSRANENAAIDSLADGDAAFDDPAAAPAPVPAPPAEATRRYPALRPVSPQPSATTSPASSTQAPASGPATPAPAPAIPPATPPAEPAPVPPPSVPEPPAEPEPAPAPEPPADPTPAPDPVPDPSPNPAPAPDSVPAPGLVDPPAAPAGQGPGNGTGQG